MDSKLKKPLPSTIRWQYLRSKNQERRRTRPRLRQQLNTNPTSPQAAATQQAFTNVQSQRSRLSPSNPAHEVEIWQGGEFETALSQRAAYIPPSVLCLEQNQYQTLAYLAGVRAHGNRVIQTKEKVVKRKKNKLPQIKGYTDFSKLDRISTAAAVVLTAEYDRIGKFNNETPPTVNLNDWSDPVFVKLYQLGFFEVLGHAPPTKSGLLMYGNTQTMQIIRAKSNDDLAKVDSALTTLGQFLDMPDEVVIELNTALSEAISNMIHHAYPIDMLDGFSHLRSLWISATADRDLNSLTVVAYDQGATIPVTYPRISRIQKVGRYLGRALRGQTSFENQNDGTYIRAAMRYGGSRTDQTHRGKGLPQMLDVLNRIGSGKMKVYSRGGWCEKASGTKFHSGSQDLSLGGTLIEWTLELSNHRTVVAA